ncbi:MAG: ATP-binding protein [Phycisphaerales bacterium]|nr:ATP-binding protein [Phycisphaerales bacterium]
MATIGAMLMLQVIEGPDQGRVFPLPEGEPQLIGRSTEAFPLVDMSISRRHAELTPDGRSWFVNDLDSANGTLLNGQPVSGRTELAIGDELRCGSTMLRFIDSSQDIGGPTGSLEQDRLASVGRTVASISHAIKNILQGLRGGASAIELAIDRGDLDMAREGWPILSRNLDRIYDLTFNMLAYSRVRALELDSCDLNLIVEELVALVEPLAIRKKARLIVECDAGIGEVSCDANAMHQALLNLLLNGVEAVEGKTGQVTIRTRPGQDGSWVDVQDNGPGIDPERHGEVFRPFASTKGQRGTGLGLAVTQRIIEDHGGFIELESDGRTGTCFRLFLPAAGPGDPGETRAPQAPPRGSDSPRPMVDPPDLADEFD